MDAICSISDCGEPRKTRGFCRTHYQRWCRHGDQMDRSPIRYPQTQLCKVDDCLRPSERQGYCVKHSYRWRTYGDPEVVLVEYDPVQRFHASYFVSPAGCWIWTGTDRNQFGHARIAVHGERAGAHRFAYELYIGPIPDGLVLDHLCKNPACVNPTHLEPVTQPENVARAETAITTINSKKTHCIRGHPLSGPNLRISSNNGRPSRQCRACQAIRARERAARVRLMS